MTPEAQKLVYQILTSAIKKVEKYNVKLLLYDLRETYRKF